MSTSACIFVLFRNEPGASRLAEIEETISNRVGHPVSSNPRGYERMVPAEDADLLADINDDGSLHYLSEERPCKLIGVPAIQGRLFVIHYLSRHWQADSYAGGPAIDYAITLLTLMAQLDVERVWYTTDDYQLGCCVPPMTPAIAHQMIDDFITVGDIFQGRTVRHWWLPDGSATSF